MAIDNITYAAAKKYTDKSIAGGGAIKGKNCVVDSIMDITGGHRVTFKWTLDDGTVQTGYMDVMDGIDGVDGADGRGIDSVDIDTNNHLIITYDDGTDHDAGEIQVTGQTIQRNQLPPASETELGHIYQYIGLNTADLVNGYFYQCVADGSGYKWEEKTVQRAGGTIVIDQELDSTSHNAVENMAIAVPVQALQGSVLDLKAAIRDLDLLVASKVDKEAGKGLSSNDFTNTEKQKLDKLQPIYLIGSGLTLEGSTLKATGMSIPIDTELDPTSVNPVQNKAIAVPIQALQGSMSTKANKSELPTKLSDLNNDTGFITKAVNDLANYYLKTEVYTIAQVDTLIAAVSSLDIEVVQTLPTTNISTTTIYLVPKPSAFQQNVYDEYICLDATTTPATWEKIGDTEIDLTNYIQKSNTSGLVKNDGSIDTQLPLTVTALQGSVAGVKLNVTQLQGSLSNKADKVTNATNGNFAGLNASGNITDSGKSPLDFLYGSVVPTPAASITDAALKQAINGAGSNDNKVPSAYAMKKWSNVLTKRYIVEGTSDPSTSPIGETGIGTWYDGDEEDIDPTTDEADWIELTDLVDIDSADDIDVGLKFDPLSGEPITLGGYIIDTDTGKMCVKFGNKIATPANAKVAIDISFMRNEYSTI